MVYMKSNILVFGFITASAFAQNCSNLFLGNINTPINNTSCYQATPAVVAKAQPEQVLFQSTDGGTTWIDLSKGLPKGTDANAIFEKNGELFLGTRDGQLFKSNHPEAANWEQQNVEGRTNPGFINGIFNGPSGTYACFLREGFYRQLWGTNNWIPMHNNLEDKEVYAIVETGSGMIFTACGTGIYRTHDDGKTWKQVYSKGWVNALTLTEAGIIANDANGLLRTTDNGEHWDYVLPDFAAHYKTFIIDDYLVAIRQNGPPLVIISHDGGDTWKQMDVGMPNDKKIYDLEKLGNYIFSSRNGGISRSFDLGKSWQLLLTPPLDDKNPMVFELFTSGTTLFALMRQGGC
jgi:photosystem II stability/assembly factor-like uncharacterized protein